MKRLIMMLLCVFLLAGSAQAVTIEGMSLFGGDGATFDTWQSDGQAWSTLSWSTAWVLGVSSSPGGPLLNQADTSISGLSVGNYYLYAEPTYLGNNPQLVVYLSDNTNIAAIFNLNGLPDSGAAWTLTAGDESLTLGWALGTADLVGGGKSIVPSGDSDFYLIADPCPAPVPLPPTVWLFGSGLLGLVGWRRFRKV